MDDILARHRVQHRAPRLLPARVGVYFLLAQALFAGVGALGIWQKLTRGVSFSQRRPSEKALRDLRARIGTGPMRELFDALAGPLAPPHTIGVGYRGLRTVAFDGCASTKVPDNEDNTSWLGKILHKVGWAGYPTVMIVALVETGTRGLLGAVFGTRITGETAWACRLLRHLGPGMLVLLDRAFDANDFLTRTAATGAHLLVRLQSKRRPPIRAKLPDGSYLTEFDGLRVRVIEARTHALLADGRVVGGTYRLATTLLDHRRDPAARLVRLYHERWEIESAFLALRHTLMQGRVLRSTTPNGLEQELWAILCACQVLRRAMVDSVPAGQRLDPDRLSFTVALRCAQESVGGAEGVLDQTPWTDTAFAYALRAAIMPPRRPRLSTRKVKSPISRYHERKDDGRPTRSTRVRLIRTLVDAPTGEVEPLVIRPPGISERVLNVMRAEPCILAWHAPDLLKRLVGTTENQIHKCLYRLTRSGILRRISHGSYELLTTRRSR
ncbi:IS4 family transposase [Streptosporangium sp. NPDC006013]|uniref:IS4 family transposase n=1 Tax=Streptosporangium sp. NPDC006013 TaxID=3155596 RepID=UPI0033B46397